MVRYTIQGELKLLLRGMMSISCERKVISTHIYEHEVGNEGMDTFKIGLVMDWSL